MSGIWGEGLLISLTVWWYRAQEHWSIGALDHLSRSIGGREPGNLGASEPGDGSLKQDTGMI